MPHLRTLRRTIRRAKLPESIPSWETILVLAVTSNSYSIDFQIRVLLYLHLKKYRELMEWADAMSQTVYETPMLHYRMHQFAALVRKYPLDRELTGYNPQGEAISKFHKAEHRCKRVNQRFRAIRRTGRGLFAPEFWHAKNWIQYVLSDTPDLESIYKSCDITAGASLGVHGNATNLARKLSCKDWTVTRGAVPYALGAIWSNDHLREFILNPEGKEYYSVSSDIFEENLQKRLQLVRYNKISFVPKTAKTDRSIAVEPFLNTYLQKGVDSFMRQRLKRVGLDLSDQLTNCEMAFCGSLPEVDPYCTIDLSSASDTISLELVKELLPFNWYTLLYDLRSHSFEYNGEIRRYEKFTSMGNGFCFPLETLLFASLCHACYVSTGNTPDFRVYGDDIVVRRSVYDKVIAILSYAGFTPNPRKTFYEGPFRESCGMDWHTGVNVRPIYLDHPLDTLNRWFGFHNQSLRRESYVRDYFENIREFLLKGTPECIRMCSPFDPGITLENGESTDKWEKTVIDGAFWVPLDVFMGQKLSFWNRETQSWGFYTCLQTARSDSEFLPVQEGNSLLFHMAALRGGSSTKPFTLRYSTETKVVRRNPHVNLKLPLR